MSGLLLALTLVRYIRQHTGPVDATVSLERADTESPGASSRRSERALTVPDKGEVYRTAERLRETAAVAYVAAVLAIDQEMRRTPLPSARVLISLLNHSNLLPPGVTASATPDAVESERAIIYLRYRSRPLGIEVVSIGRSPLEGPALMVRVPGEGEQGDRGVAFIAAHLTQREFPPPFVSTRSWIEGDWIEHSLTTTNASQEETSALFDWIASVNKTRRR